MDQGGSGREEEEEEQEQERKKTGGFQRKVAYLLPPLSIQLEEALATLSHTIPCLSVTDCRRGNGAGELISRASAVSSSPCFILLLAFLQLQLFCSSICCSCLISTTATPTIHPSIPSFLLSLHSLLSYPHPLSTPPLPSPISNPLPVPAEETSFGD